MVMGAIRRIWCVLMLLAASGPLLAQSDSGRLTLDSVLTFHAKTLEPLVWEAGGQGYFKLERSTQGVAELVHYGVETGIRTTVVPADRLVPERAVSPLVIEHFDISADGQQVLIFTESRRVWRSNTRGDYWLLDLRTWRLRKLGGAAAPSSLMFAKFSPDGSRVAYVRDNNLYVETVTGGFIAQLTTDGSSHVVNGTFDWVYEEELFCRDGFRWSPDGRHIAYWQLNSEGVKEMELINNTAALYPIISRFPYPKAGEMNSAARVGVVASSGGATRWFDVEGDPRNHYLPRMEWAAGSDEVVIQQLNRLQNTNVVMLGDVHSGKVRRILVEQDEAWVDIVWPGMDWDKKGLARGDPEWVDRGARFLWASERDGWRRVYSISREGQDVRAITPRYDVISIEGVDHAGGWLYFLASPENPTQRYLFRAALDGNGTAERLTPADQPGTHTYLISPGGRFAIHTRSTFDTAPVTGVVRLPAHTAVGPLLIDNTELSNRLAAAKWGSREFLRIDIGEGVALDAWIIKPPAFDPTKRYPALFYVYGEPWAQTVLDAWEGERMVWHRMLAQQGYIIVSVDNRGTPGPKGRAWRKAIHRKIGVLTSADQAGAVRAMLKLPFIDATRIGIWGWSGGGTSTLHAMFRYPDLYQVGISIAPVANIRYYDTIYQERYSGLPQHRADEYRQSSASTFAGELRGHLLVVHGTGDDNVHYQSTETLIDALVAAHKPFTMMAYPNRSHFISEGAGTTRHLFALLTRFLHERLPPGAR
jgi:dipeptidyl-peptidase-4